MELKEFQTLTGHDVLPGTFARFETMYMHMDLDKATFCRSIAEWAAEYDETVIRPRVAELECKARDLDAELADNLRILKSATERRDWETVEKAAEDLRNGEEQLKSLKSELMRLDGQLR